VCVCNHHSPFCCVLPRTVFVLSQFSLLCSPFTFQRKMTSSPLLLPRSHSDTKLVSKGKENNNNTYCSTYSYCFCSNKDDIYPDHHPKISTQGGEAAHMRSGIKPRSRFYWLWKLRTFFPFLRRVQVACICFAICAYWDLDALCRPLGSMEQQVLVTEARSLRVSLALQKMHPYLVPGADPLGVGANIMFFTFSLGDCSGEMDPSCITSYTFKQRVLNIALLCLSSLAIILLYRNLCCDHDVLLKITPSAFAKRFLRVSYSGYTLSAGRFVCIPASYICALLLFLHPLQVEACLTLYHRRDLIVLFLMLTSFAFYTKGRGGLYFWQHVLLYCVTLCALTIALILDRRMQARMWVPIFAIFEAMNTRLSVTAQLLRTAGVISTLQTLSGTIPLVLPRCGPFSWINGHFITASGFFIPFPHRDAEVYLTDMRFLGTITVCLMASCAVALQLLTPTKLASDSSSSTTTTPHSNNGLVAGEPFGGCLMPHAYSIRRAFLVFAATWMVLSVYEHQEGLAHSLCFVVLVLLYPPRSIFSTDDALRHGSRNGKMIDQRRLPVTKSVLTSRVWLFSILLLCFTRTKWLVFTWPRSERISEEPFNPLYLLRHVRPEDPNCDYIVRALMISEVNHPRCMLARCLLYRGFPGRALVQLRLWKEDPSLTYCSIYNEVYRKAIWKLSKDPDLDPIDRMLGSRISTQDFDAATYLSGFQLPQTRAHFSKAAVAIRHNRLKDAYSHYEDAIQTNPFDSMAHFHAGMVALSMKLSHYPSIKARLPFLFFDSLLLDPRLPLPHFQYCKATKFIFYCENAKYTGIIEAGEYIEELKEKSQTAAQNAETFTKSVQEISDLVSAMDEALSDRIVEYAAGKRFVVMNLWNPLTAIVEALKTASCEQLLVHEGPWSSYTLFKQRWKDSIQKFLDLSIIEKWNQCDNNLRMACVNTPDL